MPKVFITGLAGFLGSHCAEVFTSYGWSVRGIDSLTKYELNHTKYNIEKARESNLTYLNSIGAELIIGDIRNFDLLFKWADGCDYIIHTAAQPTMTLSIKDPRYSHDVNIMGTQNVLEVARILKVPIAVCSSIHVYGTGINDVLDYSGDRCKISGKGTTQIIDEQWPTLSGTLTPLHSEKFCNEMDAAVLSHSYNIPSAAFRFTGIAGSRAMGNEEHGWICNFVVKTILHEQIHVFGTNKQVRDPIFNNDAAMAFYQWFAHGCKPGVYNICGGLKNILSIKECLDRIAMITGIKQDIVTQPARTGDLHYFVGDYSKAQKAFGWFPTILPGEGLVKLVEWVKSNKELFIVD